MRSGIARSDSNNSVPQRPVILGVCAMNKKTTSKAMTAVLDRIRAYGEFTVIIINEAIFFNEPIENWPIVECLLGFFSSGFPLDKLKAYVNLRQPFCINDVHSQQLLRSRISVMDIIRKNGVPTLPYLRIDRSKNQKIVESEKWLQVDDRKLYFPLIEKPWDADDHDIWVHYGKGGGVRKLFRKIKDRSSEYDPHHNGIRNDGRNYVYEPFLATARDVKLYAVGMDYAHGETRKSPTVDGKVERDPDNKELRMLTRLTQNERDICAKVCRLFRQNICGFDVIRFKAKSYVIDVNGFSLSKGSLRYADQAARTIRRMCLGCKKGRAVMFPPQGLPYYPREYIRPKEEEGNDDAVPSMPVADTSFRSGFNHHRLLAMVTVFRHADRGPKHKVKWVTDNATVLAFYAEQAEKIRAKQNKEDEAEKKARDEAASDGQKASTNDDVVEKQVDKDEQKKKKKKEEKNKKKLVEVKLTCKKEAWSRFKTLMEAVHGELSQKQLDPLKKPVASKKRPSFNQSTFGVVGGSTKTGPFPGQTPPLPNQPRKLSADEQARKLHKRHFESLQKTQEIIRVLGMMLEASKLQLKAKTIDPQTDTVQSVEVICKWGGAITHAGKTQTKAYVPVFWDEMLRPKPPNPPDITLDPEPEQVFEEPLTEEKATSTENNGATDDSKNDQDDEEFREKDEEADEDVDDGVIIDDEIEDVDETEIVNNYDNPAYKIHRNLFLQNMKVYASAEARVHATARAFIAATLTESDDNLSVKLISDKTVYAYLDDVGEPARKAMMLAKSDIKKLVMSKVNYFKDEEEKERIVTENKAKKEARIKEVDDEDGDALSSALLYQMRVSHMEDNDDPVAANVMTVPHSTPLVRQQSALGNRPMNAEERVIQRRLLRELPLTSEERGMQFSMTKWGIRCLRWLDVPYDSLSHVYGLAKSLQHQIYGRLGLEWTDGVIPEEKGFEDYFKHGKRRNPSRNNVSTRTFPPVKNLKKSPAVSPTKNNDNDATPSSSPPDVVTERPSSSSSNSRPGSRPGSSSSSTKPSLRARLTPINVEGKDGQPAPPSPVDADQQYALCQGETLWSVKERWDRLLREFYDAETGKFDATKVPDLYDNIQFDVVHNRPFLQNMRSLYRGIKQLSDFVIPQEYGVLRQEKLFIAMSTCDQLLDRILANLEDSTKDSCEARVHMYFSSESHLHALRNILLLAGLARNKTVATALESFDIGYLSHTVFRLFEDESLPPDDPLRLYVNVQFSPGATMDPFTFLQPGHHIPVSRPAPVNGRVPFALFRQMFHSSNYYTVVEPGELNEV